MPEPTIDEEAAESLAAAWQRARRVAVLTGAGISTASGIPDFRSPGGRWEKYQPTPIQDFLASEAAREEYWCYKGESWRLLQQAAPNPGHDALAALANGGHVELLATQNVDGLHDRSGFPRERQIDVHGSDAAVVCMQCGERGSREAAQLRWEAGERVPSCRSCGGPLKPATISFGQSLVEADLTRAFEAAAHCELLVAIGTSLVVGPINQMVPIAHRAGAEIAILTASETPYDDLARWRLDAPLEELLTRIAGRVLGSAAG